jgi:cephalosporin hydroxylase
MNIEKRSTSTTAAAWARLWARRKPADTPAGSSVAPVCYPGFGDIDIRPRQDGLTLDFPDNAALARSISDAVSEHPRDRVRTFFESILRNRIKPIIDRIGESGLAQLQGDQLRAIETIRFLFARRVAGRYQDYVVRKEIWGSEVPAHVLAMSQGVTSVMHWRGIPLVKSVFDVSLYMMLLWDLMPRTIIEIGSASGGSAAWLADLMVSYGLDCHVYSMDIVKPELLHPGVTFMQGDSNKIEEALPRDLLERLTHPWLFVEDAHVNVAGVLEWIHIFAQAGDYFVIEDTTSDAKEADAARFIAKHQSEYKVDTFYTDFFGYNACSSRDCVWRRF